jgi:hypothetical protein
MSGWFECSLEEEGAVDPLLETALERVRQLITAHDELQLWDDTPVQSATNRVLYGARAGAPVVFKCFGRKARKWQEERALQWLAASGVVRQDPFWSTSFDAFFDETLVTCRDALVRHRIDQPALHASVRQLQAVRSEVLARPTFMHVDDIHGATSWWRGTGSRASSTLR